MEKNHWMFERNEEYLKNEEHSLCWTLVEMWTTHYFFVADKRQPSPRNFLKVYQFFDIRWLWGTKVFELIFFLVKSVTWQVSLVAVTAMRLVDLARKRQLYRLLWLRFYSTHSSKPANSKPRRSDIAARKSRTFQKWLKNARQDI